MALLIEKKNRKANWKKKHKPNYFKINNINAAVLLTFFIAKSCWWLLLANREQVFTSTECET